MPNKNYAKGRRLEYELAKKLRNAGWVTLRTAGSHGFADLVCVRSDVEEPRVRFIQVKGYEVSSQAQADFKKKPPIIRSTSYTQELWWKSNRQPWCYCLVE